MRRVCCAHRHALGLARTRAFQGQHAWRVAASEPGVAARAAVDLKPGTRWSWEPRPALCGGGGRRGRTSSGQGRYLGSPVCSDSTRMMDRHVSRPAADRQPQSGASAAQPQTAP